MQLLKITTVPIKYKVEQETVPSESDQSFNLNLERNMSNVKIPVSGSEKSQNSNDKIRDQSNFKANGVQGARSDSMVHENSQNGTENNYDVKYCYGRKNVSADNSVHGSAIKNQNFSGASLEAAMDSMESVIPDKSWEPDLNKDNSENKITQVHHKTVKEHQTRKTVEEFAHVEIEYLGGFNYVPKSSAPDYEDPEEK